MLMLLFQRNWENQHLLESVTDLELLKNIVRKENSQGNIKRCRYLKVLSA